MAKIMGLELKAVKTFLGSDGYGLNANLYLNGKKVAFVLDEGRGGESEVTFTDKSKEDEVFAIAQRYYEKYPKFLLHDNKWAKLYELLEELYALYETEKYFKKQSKKGYLAVVEVRYNKRTEDFTKNYDPTKRDCMVAFIEWDEKAEKYLIDKYKPVEFKVYQRLEDFIIE
jgi:hypothetical protein